MFWIDVAIAGTIDFGRPFANFHGSLMTAGGVIFGTSIAWSAIEYKMRKRLDHLVEHAAPVLIGGGMMVYSLPFGQALVPGGSAAASTLAAIPLPVMAELVSDLIAGGLSWTGLCLPGWMLWRRLWPR